MIAFLSPAKHMKKGLLAQSAPAFLQDAQHLADICKQMAPAQLERCLRLSPELALKTYMTWQDWKADISFGSAATVYSGIAFNY